MGVVIGDQLTDGGRRRWDPHGDAAVRACALAMPNATDAVAIGSWPSTTTALAPSSAPATRLPAASHSDSNSPTAWSVRVPFVTQNDTVFARPIARRRPSLDMARE